MRLKAISLALVVSGAAASLGLAAGPPQAKGPLRNCGRFNLIGTLTGVSASSFTLKTAAGTTFTIKITSDTEAFWTGKGTLAGPTVGQSVWAKGKRCGTINTATWVLVRPKTGK